MWTVYILQILAIYTLSHSLSHAYGYRIWTINIYHALKIVTLACTCQKEPCCHAIPVYYRLWPVSHYVPRPNCLGLRKQNSCSPSPSHSPHCCSQCASEPLGPTDSNTAEERWCNTDTGRMGSPVLIVVHREALRVAVAIATHTLLEMFYAKVKYCDSTRSNHNSWYECRFLLDSGNSGTHPAPLTPHKVFDLCAPSQDFSKPLHRVHQVAQLHVVGSPEWGPHKGAHSVPVEQETRHRRPDCIHQAGKRLNLEQNMCELWAFPYMYSAMEPPATGPVGPLLLWRFIVVKYDESPNSYSKIIFPINQSHTSDFSHFRPNK